MPVDKIAAILALFVACFAFVAQSLSVIVLSRTHATPCLRPRPALAYALHMKPMRLDEEEDEEENDENRGEDDQDSSDAEEKEEAETEGAEAEEAEGGLSRADFSSLSIEELVRKSRQEDESSTLKRYEDVFQRRSALAKRQADEAYEAYWQRRGRRRKLNREEKREITERLYYSLGKNQTLPEKLREVDRAGDFSAAPLSSESIVYGGVGLLAVLGTALLSRLINS